MLRRPFIAGKQVSLSQGRVRQGELLGVCVQRKMEALMAASADPEGEPSSTDAVALAEVAPIMANSVEEPPPQSSTPPLQCAQPWFSDWANANGVSEFARLLSDAGLTGFVETCETPLTIFAPTNEAIRNLATLPSDTQLLRELLCVHITMGNLR